ncbi:MAG: hypothetical protein R6V44_18680 [Paracoccaceae bacterium]
MQVGANFAHDRRMVRTEIPIGFAIARIVATLAPAEVRAAILLTDADLALPTWPIALENAMVAPFVAAETFIGATGKIPPATVPNANGVLFAGIMGLHPFGPDGPAPMMVNAKSCGLRPALCAAGVIYVPIVLTASILNGAFELLGIVPESGRAVSDVVRFAIDNTFWPNLVAPRRTAPMLRPRWLPRRAHGARHHAMEGDGPVKRAAAKIAMGLSAAGAAAWASTA